MTIVATAPQQVPMIAGGHVAGSLTLSGVALACAIVLYLGWRKSDRLKFLHDRDGIGLFSLFTGTVWVAAGSSWASLALGVASIPAGLLGDGSIAGNIGAGGTALVLTLLVFLPKWKRMAYPALLAISAAVAYASAGGIWGIFVNTVRLTVAHFTGSA
jgi:hypothetical protein